MSSDDSDYLAAMKAASAQRQANQQAQDEQPVEDENPAPTFLTYAEFLGTKGEDGLKTMTRFTKTEFEFIVEACRTVLTPASHVRGRRPKYTPEDRILQMLCYLNSGWQLKKLAVMVFKMPPTSYTETLLQTIILTSPVLQKKFIPNSIDPRSFRRQFAFNPTAVGAVDVTLIPINKPGGGFDAQKPYYSAKHKQHGLKLQAIVNPDAICCHIDITKTGAVHDKRVWDESSGLNLVTNQQRLGNGSILTTHSPLLFDKGYTGVNRTFPEAIVTLRKPRGGELSKVQLTFNSHVESDRVIVENYFGRMKILWGILSQRFRGDRTKHLPKIVVICVALTNYYNTIHPLRAGNFDIEQAPPDDEDYSDDDGNDAHIPSSAEDEDDSDEE